MGARDVTTKNISYNQIVRKSLHRPTSKDGYILYTKVPSAVLGNDETGEPLAEKSELYRKQSTVNYNSPTNIRKVFITGNGVTVQYYSAMVLGNEQKSPKWRTVKFEDADNLFKIIKEQFEFNNKYAAHQMEKMINNKNKDKVTAYTIDGNGLGVIANPYTCSNIEEIYFDWTLLASRDSVIKKYFSEFTMNELYGFSQGNEPAGAKEDARLRDYFMEVCSGGVKNLRRRFPRLRIIAMISKLDAILKHPDNVIPDRDFQDISKATVLWFDANRELIKASGSYVLYTNLSGDLKLPNTEFNVKDSLYKFDYEKLKGVVQKHLKGIQDYQRKNNYTQVEVEPEVIGELEEYLLKIEEDCGDNRDAFKNILISAFSASHMSSTEMKETMNSITKKNRDRYAAILGYKG